jgi:hypothetical protein
MSTQSLLIGGNRVNTVMPPAARGGTNRTDKPAETPIPIPQNTNFCATLKKDPLCT